MRSLGGRIWEGSRNDSARRLMIWAIVMATGVWSGPALADRTIEGRATIVRDVDTIVVAGTPVRLNGVDGPETSTRVGREARTFMARDLPPRNHLMMSCAVAARRN